MAEDLRQIFGSDTTLTVQPRRARRQLVGYAGAHGMTSMNMGTRGRLIAVSGRISFTDADYWVARENLQAVIDAIEAYQWTDGGDYYYDSQYFYYVIFEKFEIAVEGKSKSFHRANGGKVFVDFYAELRELI